MRIANRVVAGAIVLGTLAGVGWFVWWQPPSERAAATAPGADPARSEAPRPEASHSGASPNPGRPLFRCDARTQCEQMTSCEEAMFFLQNCKVNKLNLDQDDDGIPCEIQWCQK